MYYVVYVTERPISLAVMSWLVLKPSYDGNMISRSKFNGQYSGCRIKLKVPSTPIVDGLTDKITLKVLAGDAIIIEIPLFFCYLITGAEVYV